MSRNKNTPGDVINLNINQPPPNKNIIQSVKSNVTKDKVKKKG